MKVADVQAVGLGMFVLGGALYGGLGLAAAGVGTAVGKKGRNQLADELLQQIHATIGAKAAPGPSDDIPSKLKQLAELKNQGIISEEEFDRKKKELLDRM